MPEGDTVYKVAAYLRPRLQGRVLDAGRLRGHPGVQLGARSVDAVTCHGKHLFLALSDGSVIRSHLGMYGSWHQYRPGEPWRRPRRQASIELRTAGLELVCFNAREVELLRAGGAREREIAQRLGPDLLDPGLVLDAVAERARGMLDPAAPLVDVLLDQRLACGVGNVYKSEVLFVERRAPLLRLGEIDDAALSRLYRTARDLLGRNKHGGPRVTCFKGGGTARHWVYGRRHRRCLRCGTPIRYARLGRGLRATYWCPRCQPSG